MPKEDKSTIAKTEL